MCTVNAAVLRPWTDASPSVVDAVGASDREGTRIPPNCSPCREKILRGRYWNFGISVSISVDASHCYPEWHIFPVYFESYFILLLVVVVKLYLFRVTHFSSTILVYYSFTQGQFLLDNVIDSDKVYSFELEQDAPIQRKKKFVSIRSQVRGAGGDGSESPESGYMSTYTAGMY